MYQYWNLRCQCHLCVTWLWGTAAIALPDRCACAADRFLNHTLDVARRLPDASTLAHVGTWAPHFASKKFHCFDCFGCYDCYGCRTGTRSGHSVLGAFAKICCYRYALIRFALTLFAYSLFSDMSSVCPCGLLWIKNLLGRFMASPWARAACCDRDPESAATGWRWDIEDGTQGLWGRSMHSRGAQKASSCTSQPHSDVRWCKSISLMWWLWYGRDFAQSMKRCHYSTVGFRPFLFNNILLSAWMSHPRTGWFAISYWWTNICEICCDILVELD